MYLYDIYLYDSTGNHPNLRIESDRQATPKSVHNLQLFLTFKREQLLLIVFE